MNEENKQEWAAVAAAFVASVAAMGWYLDAMTRAEANATKENRKERMKVLEESDMALAIANAMRERVVEVAERLLHATSPELKLYELLYVVTDSVELEVTTDPATTERDETWRWEHRATAVMEDIARVTDLLSSPDGATQAGCVGCIGGERS